MQLTHSERSLTSDATDGDVLELKLVGEITGSFRVARYQRGYRWGTDDVERLLNDIWESEGKPYNLQPVVVKRDAADCWELVDGQQRLTTLYLIFVYMQRAGLKNVAPQYTITYDTKATSRDYLHTLNPDLAKDDIDFFHLYSAFATIRRWFDKKGPTSLKLQEVADDVFRYLMKSVRVIWYEAPTQLDSTTLFTRLNVGRIPLTDAELFKALLLSRSRGAAGASDRTQEVAAQWDSIERSLWHPDIWWFIADDAAVETPTRITLLLDTIADEPKDPNQPRIHSFEAPRARRPRFFTFEALRTRVEEHGAEEVWNTVVDLHALVLGWYESRDHFHKIGYLIAVGQRFAALVALARDRAKSEFGAMLDARIRETVNLTPSGVTELSYEKSPQKCRQLLLLMNVETIRRLKGSSERYSFRIHREQDWSLEHIHAQSAESLTKVEDRKKWLKLQSDALADLPMTDEARRAELLRRIADAGDKIESKAFAELARDVSAAFTPVDSSPAAATHSVHSVHSVSNLALLESGDNSALSNSVFEVKRRRILELDREGSYIPICTRQVFLKYYTEADAQQIHFWGPQDREAYLNAILSTDGGVGAYLKPEKPLA